MAVPRLHSTPGQRGCCHHRTGCCKHRLAVGKFSAGFGIVYVLWIFTLLAPRQADATWMWLGAASLGAGSVGHDSNPQQQQPEPDTPPITTVLLDPAQICRQFPGLTADQRKVCESTPDIINIVTEGAKVGIMECQRQFSTERWNCSVIGDVENPFGEVMTTGNKETAFIYAITSAGVVYSVTRSCSLGNLTQCGCTSPKGKPSGEAIGDAEQWRWGGCSDDVDYGIKLARKFVDAADESSSSSSSSSSSPISSTTSTSREDGVKEMNLHNNEAGRQVMKTEMATQCRCHGVSASCSMKTCWKTMPSFRQIGDLVKSRYKASIEVVVRTKKRAKLRRKDRRMRRVAIESDELVHMQRSPNYCRTDPDRGIVGTTGRECNKTSSGSDSCDLLCCGRGYNTQEIRRVERCDCKFIWCCKVKCRMCEEVLDIFTCK